MDALDIAAKYCTCLLQGFVSSCFDPHLCVLSPACHTRGNAYWGIRRLVFWQENFRRKDLWTKGRGSVQPVVWCFPLCRIIFELCIIIPIIIVDKYSIMQLCNMHAMHICACVHCYIWARNALHRRVHRILLHNMYASIYYI